MTIIAFSALIAVPVVIWRLVGADVLRVGYLPVKTKPSAELQDTKRPRSALRHEGVLHICMVDHADSALVLIVLRLDSGKQRILSVRTDDRGFGNARLLRWCAGRCRVRVTERERAGEVVFRAFKTRPSRFPSPASWPLPTWVRPVSRPTGFVVVRGHDTTLS